MPRQACDSLIVTLAGMLAGSRVDTKTVSRALDLIRTGFSFEAGLIYEKDGTERYRLKEFVPAEKTPGPDCLPVEGFAPVPQTHLEPVFFIDEGDAHTPAEAALLDRFSASALVAAPIADDSQNVYGLAIFPGPAGGALDEDGRRAVSVLISMLVRYVSIRIYQARLSQAKTSLENILDNTGIDIYVNDFYSHDILYVNKSMAAPYGGQEQFVGKKCWQILFPGQNGPCEFCPQQKIINGRGEPGSVYTWDYQRPFDGSWFRVFSAAFRWTDGRLAHVVSSADITDNKRKEALIEYMANYDPLTGLPNRRKLINDCELRIDRSTEAEKGYLLFFDIDGFKSINDRFGHDAGDEFLVKLGEFFSRIPLLKDAIYRNGGDEFVAVIGGESVTKDNIKNLAGFIHLRFQKPWTLKSGDVFCNVSIGVACYPEDGSGAEELLRKADQAMYRIKKSGGAGVCFGYELE